jgi:hypothetical protein
MTPTFQAWWFMRFGGITTPIGFYPNGEAPYARFGWRDHRSRSLSPLTALTFPG